MVGWVLTVLIGAMALLAGAFGMVQHRQTEPANLPRHPIRRRILDHLKRGPGASISDVCRQVSIGWGTAQHHLYLLERAELVASMQTGRSHRFFLTGTPAVRMEKMALLRRGRIMDVVQVIVESPGVRQGPLTRRLALSRRVFRRYADLLVERELIDEVRQGQACMYFPTPELVGMLSRSQAVASANGRSAVHARGNGSVPAAD